MLKLIGERFPVLNKKGQPILHIECECFCGKRMVRQYWSAVKNKSCGCLVSELSRKQMTTHDLSHTKTYEIWYGMNRRCYDPKHKDYKSYGKKGVTVSKEWRESFETFLSDMGERPEGLSIDRIDNNLGYSKENCRWATNKTQCRNKRAQNKILTINGVSKTAIEWSEVEGAESYPNILWRSRNGWSDEDAVFKKSTRKGIGGRPKKNKELV
jgi:hypothetical protein